MSWLTSPAHDLFEVAVKATLIYGTALLGLRVGERRTLAQWTTIDFAAAVTIGAIVGRTALAKDQSYAVGAVALVTIVAVHRLASLLRFSPLFGKLQDHRIRVLVVNGELRRRQLRLCGLTELPLKSWRLLHGGWAVLQGQVLAGRVVALVAGEFLAEDDFLTARAGAASTYALAGSVAVVAPLLAEVAALTAPAGVDGAVAA